MKNKKVSRGNVPALHPSQQPTSNSPTPIHNEIEMKTENDKKDNDDVIPMDINYTIHRSKPLFDLTKRPNNLAIAETIAPTPITIKDETNLDRIQIDLITPTNNQSMQTSPLTFAEREKYIDRMYLNHQQKERLKRTNCPQNHPTRNRDALTKRPDRPRTTRWSPY